jgi:hypothetical protein
VRTANSQAPRKDNENCCSCMQKEKQTSKKNQQCSYLSPDEGMILHEDISNPIIIPCLYFPMQLMIFSCLPAHHFSATNKNSLYYGCCTNTNRTYWFFIFLHTRMTTAFESISNYYLNIHIL